METVKGIGALVFLLFMLAVIMDGCSGNGGYNKEAEDAYKRLRDQGFTAQEIYEMGKDK